MPKQKKSLYTILGLILATAVAMAAMGTVASTGIVALPGETDFGNGPVHLSTELVQDKVLLGGDGRVTVALDLAVSDLPASEAPTVPATDLVIVLDRSGSMEGEKLRDAKQAVVGMLHRLGPSDRLALVTYANDVRTPLPLLSMNEYNRGRMASAVTQVVSGGGTNLGGGMKRAMDILMTVTNQARQRKMILISDGLANQGITDPLVLGQLASAAVENHFSISTIGVGLDFNEILMTAIADQGAGHYHFLENPELFASVFEAEFLATRKVAAADVSIRVPVSSGVQLIGAGGYPIRTEDGGAVFYPGNLLSGQHRKLHLTFRVPTDDQGKIRIPKIRLQYRHGDRIVSIATPSPMAVACVPDAASVVASINKAAWADRVVQEDFNELKAKVAERIRSGDREGAKKEIRSYMGEKAAANAVVGSGKVARNLEVEVKDLGRQVDETFMGSPSAVEQKQKQISKSMQHESYTTRRNIGTK